MRFWTWLMGRIGWNMPSAHRSIDDRLKLVLIADRDASVRAIEAIGKRFNDEA